MRGTRRHVVNIKCSRSPPSPSSESLSVSPLSPLLVRPARLNPRDQLGTAVNAIVAQMPRLVLDLRSSYPSLSNPSSLLTMSYGLG